jgi:hypothetical protein
LRASGSTLNAFQTNVTNAKASAARLSNSST